MSLEDFPLATAFVQKSPKDGALQTSNNDKLVFYKYYKQATVGDCNTPPPSILNVSAKSMHKAWTEVSGMTKEEAKQKYVEVLTKLLPTWKEEAKKLNITV